MQNIINAESLNIVNELCSWLEESKIELIDVLSQTIHHESDKEDDSPCPMLSLFYQPRGNKILIEMKHFSFSKLTIISEYLYEYVFNKWRNGRGASSTVSALDEFSRHLKVLKHGGTWRFLSKMLKYPQRHMQEWFLNLVIKLYIQYRAIILRKIPNCWKCWNSSKKTCVLWVIHSWNAWLTFLFNSAIDRMTAFWSLSRIVVENTSYMDTSWS